MKDNVYDEMEEFVTYSTIIRQGKALKGKERESSMIRIWYDKMEKSIKKKKKTWRKRGIKEEEEKKKAYSRKRVLWIYDSLELLPINIEYDNIEFDDIWPG